MTDPERREVTDPDGRPVVFDAGTRLHLAMGRPDLLDHVDAILGAIERRTIASPIRGPAASASSAGTSIQGGGFGWS